MLEIAHSEAYRDQPVYEIYHDLLQQGIYLGSLSTWYRQLREAKESGDRRPQRAPQHHAVPRITARAANEAWTWDIVRHEALWKRAVMKEHCHWSVAADR